MTPYIVHPPIRNDLDYYRFDDNIIKLIIDGRSLLVVGLRRSGKTSFLFRVERRAIAEDKSVLFFNSQNFFLEGDVAKNVNKAVSQIKNNPDAIILLDEADTFKPKDSKSFTSLLLACRNQTLIIACAPIFFLELSNYPSTILDFFEGFRRHQLGSLTRKEALALLSQLKRKGPPPISQKKINNILSSGERLPIILQALGAKHTEGIDIAVSLTSLVPYIFSGLTESSKNALVLAAHGLQLDINSTEVQLLKALGALIEEKDRTTIRVASRILRNIIKASTKPPGSHAIIIKTNGASDFEWKRYASILHLSDLHFGPHCIEKPQHTIDRQLSRLISVLEQDEIHLDNIVITGDISWSGHRADLRDAEKFLNGLAKWYSKHQKWSIKKARRHIILIPGNHEAAWSLTNGLKNDEINEWVCYSIAPFANLFNRFYKGDVVWDLEHPCQSRCYSDPKIAFISISTSHFITKKRREGEFGSGLQEEVIKLLNKSNVRKARFRLGLIHHNLRSFHKDGKVICDGEGAIQRFVRCKPTFDLILHGHAHQGEVDVFKPRGGLDDLPYSSVGSFGVRAEDRPGDDKRGRINNEFAIVNLEISGASRRFTTQFYQLSYTSTGNWEWKAGLKSAPRIL